MFKPRFKPTFKALSLVMVGLGLTACNLQISPSTLASLSPSPAKSASPSPIATAASPTPSSTKRPTPSPTQSPNATQTQSPSPTASPILNPATLSRGSFKFKWDPKALSEQDRQELGNTELQFQLRSQAMDGPSPTPVAIDDIDNKLDLSTLPQSRQPQPIYTKELKLKLGDEITLNDVPLGLALDVFLSYRFPKPTASPEPNPPCVQTSPAGPSRYLTLSQSLNLSAQSPGTVTLPLKIQFIADQDLSVIEMTNISGVVRDSNGQVLAGATVTVKALQFCQFQVQAQTDAEGKYALQQIPPGIQLEMVASKTGYSSQKRIEAASSNKIGDPNANRFDFGGPDSPKTGLQKQ